MTASAPPLPPPSQGREPSPSAAPRRRKLRASSAALGEPYLWLTGGALALALLMTTLLIGFLLRSGLETFRPLPLVEVTTTGGKRILGEVVDEERFKPEPNYSATLDPTARDACEAELQQSDGTLRRRKYRTGNFDLSGTHYTWLNDCELATVGEAASGDVEQQSNTAERMPADGVLIERREWGRFYGFTKSYVVRRLREPSAEELSLQQGLDAAARLQAVAPLPADSLAALQHSLAEERRRGVAAFLQSRPAADGATVEIETTSGTTLTVDAASTITVPPDADVRAVVLRWTDADAAWTRLSHDLPGVQSRLAEKRHLEEGEAGRLNERENRALVALRAAAMQHEMDVSLHLDRLKHVEEARQRRLADLADVRRLATVAAAKHGADSAAAKATAALVQAVESRNAEADRNDSAAQTLAAQEAAWPEDVRSRFDDLRKAQADTAAEYALLQTRIAALQRENASYHWLLQTVDGAEKDLPLSDVVRTYRPNRLGALERCGVYGSRWREFLFDDPRAGNLEGGVWPAIVGTIVMTLFMSLAVVPLGVVTALYLREYAKPGPIVSIVRIAINNLAGVPSIVFGVFGLGFFCYFTGATVDDLFFPAESAASPVYGKGALIWASLTLSLMTMPVVIVATEEALAAVSNSMREGSYACGASKFQTIRRIVLPRALPGVMTGMILAMARGAGEVAPLMLVGALKTAPKLPLDASFPFVHLDRSFMHLGFYIFDLGFQSPNSEAAKPMVFTTTLLLITIVVLLNVTAIAIRSRLRRRFQGGQF